MFNLFGFFRKKTETPCCMDTYQALGEMDRYFYERPWGYYDVPRDLAGLMGAFEEEAVSPEDFNDSLDDALDVIFGK